MIRWSGRCANATAPIVRHAGSSLTVIVPCVPAAATQERELFPYQHASRTPARRTGVIFGDEDDEE